MRELAERTYFYLCRGVAFALRCLARPAAPGRTLAELLEDPTLQEPARRLAIGRAADALAARHHAGLTHAAATTANAQRRAEDVRTLLVTCLVRTAPEKIEGTLRLILNVYPAEPVARHLEASFASVWRRSLIDHLSQAALSYRTFREIGRLLRKHRGC